MSVPASAARGPAMRAARSLVRAAYIGEREREALIHVQVWICVCVHRARVCACAWPEREGPLAFITGITGVALMAAVYLKNNSEGPWHFLGLTELAFFSPAISMCHNILCGGEAKGLLLIRPGRMEPFDIGTVGFIQWSE